MTILDKINQPADIKRLSPEERETLAQEIRNKILDVVARHGGHLGSSLGAVELTIALHTVFNAPNDRLVWDTGHQTYPHKLLTGRRDIFHTLRQHHGMSGFLSREESPYDTFGAGHAGTALSAALGMAEARNLQKQNHHVIAIIGDASLTTGLTYEALNHAGGLNRDILVILNDNEMSISPNVGAISAYLNRLITGTFYTKVKQETAILIGQLPTIGPSALKVAKRAEGSMKGLVMPDQGQFFQALGFRYIGPIDGHRLDHLVTTFENLKKLKGPHLVHLITTKGKGYRPAETQQAAFHGLSAFDLSTGVVKGAGVSQKAPTYTSVFSKTLMRLAQNDPNIVAITAAMPEGTGLGAFAKQFPERFYDVGISEQHAVTLAAGMAADGLKPVVAIYSTFLQRAFDQIVHDVSLQNLPVVFCLDRAGLVGEDGPTHHGVFDIAYLKAIPNMVIMAPKDENELQQMLTWAVSSRHEKNDLVGHCHIGPIAIRYPRGEGLGVPLDEMPASLEIGKGEIVKGTLSRPDLVFFALGSMVATACAAADLLLKNGLQATVINARFAKPIDTELLISAAQTSSMMVTLEEHLLMGGFGESVLSILMRESGTGAIPPVTVLQIGLPDQFVEHGAQKTLRQEKGLVPDAIATRVAEWYEKCRVASPTLQGASC